MLQAFLANTGGVVVVSDAVDVIPGESDDTVSFVDATRRVLVTFRRQDLAIYTHDGTLLTGSLDSDSGVDKASSVQFSSDEAFKRENPAFAKFVQRRRLLNEQLDRTRTAIEAWFDERRAQPPGISALATLEGLLAARRKVFEDFIEAHEAFVEQAIRTTT
jgi:hypothetical protein